MPEWEAVPAQAELHGMAPLLYFHLKAAGIQLPTATRQELQGLYLRHRRANWIRTEVLRRILRAYESAGVQVLLLKGAALAHMVYPEPGLRPMSDLDLLVKKEDARRAQGLLAELGFQVSLPTTPQLPHRHLATAAIQEEGVLVQAEVHHRLSSNYLDDAIAYLRGRLTRGRRSPEAHASDAFDGLTVPPQPIALDDLTAHTLGHVDMLGHLCQHLLSHVNVWDFGRLIWIADLVSVAERFASRIDWELVRCRYPAVSNTLSLVHFMTPLSDDVLTRAGVKLGRSPQGIGVEFQGWPHLRRADWRGKGNRRVLHDTIFPSEWWLRLRYKVGSARPLLWYRWVRHPLHILGQIGRALLEKTGWPTYHKLAGQNSNSQL